MIWRPVKSRLQAIPRPFIILVFILILLILFLYLISFLLDNKIRTYIEKEMNNHLKGYHVKIASAHLQILSFKATLKGVQIIQNQHPIPPIVKTNKIITSVQWKELLFGHLVADSAIFKPEISINLPQLLAEKTSKLNIREEGWQKALESVFPLKINSLRVMDADIKYTDEKGKHPLHIEHLNLTANNIRNIHLPEGNYPSPVHAEATVFDIGKAQIDGSADFLQTPHLAIHSKFNLKNIPLNRLRSYLTRGNIQLKNGILSSEGEIIFTPRKEVVHIYKLFLEHINLDYIHSLTSAQEETSHIEKLKSISKEVVNRPSTLLKMDLLLISDSEFGFINLRSNHKYRLFMSKSSLRLENFTNQLSTGVEKINLSGEFMGSGKTSLNMVIRPETHGPNFDLKARIENTDLPSLNNLLLSYGKFDVAKGTFSLYMDIHVKNNQINGYIKPFFKNMKVYDRRKDADKSLFRKLYEMLVGGVSSILKNPQNTLATKAKISGKLEKPTVNTWQVLVKIFQNAFFHMILPGFDKNINK